MEIYPKLKIKFEKLISYLQYYNITSIYELQGQIIRSEIIENVSWRMLL